MRRRAPQTGARIRLGPADEILRPEPCGDWWRTESSVEVRAGVNSDRSDLKHLVVAGELIEDATGKSSLYVPGKRSRPEPDRHGRVTSTLGPVGITIGQTLRVTFLNVGSSPLELEPCIFDGDGAHLKEGATLTLAPERCGRSVELGDAVGGAT